MGFLIPKEKQNVTHRNCLLVVVGSDSAERLKKRLRSLIIAMHSCGIRLWRRPSFDLVEFRPSGGEVRSALLEPAQEWKW